MTSWKTSLIGVLAGIINYVAALGPNLPTTGKDWGTVLLSAVLAALGFASKDANVSNAPNPMPTAKPVV